MTLILQKGRSSGTTVASSQRADALQAQSPARRRKRICKSMGLLSKQDVEREGYLHALGDVQN